jgi:LemA protein
MMFLSRFTVRALTMLMLCTTVASCGYNSVMEEDEKVKATWANVQNLYTRRAELVPNLVATVKGSANFEKDTLTQVTEARAKVGQMRVDANTLENPERFKQFEAAQSQLSGALSRLMVVAEKYPELKSTDAFRDLQSQLEGTENRISVERSRYVEAVRSYNTVVQVFPTMIGAKLRGKDVRPTFEATAEQQKAPEVKF